MPPSRPDDQSLLDRLNALKPTAVTFEKPANATVLGPETQPVSREDALAARLRLLRSQPSSSHASHDKGGSQAPGVQGHDGAGTAPPPPVKRPAQEEMVSRASSGTPDCLGNVSQGPSSYRFIDSEIDDEAALDELLEALGDEDFDLAADQGAEPPHNSDPRGNAEGVAALPKSHQRVSGTLTVEQENTSAAGDDDDDDDSDGEQMSRAVETILAQIGDEINALPPPAALPAESESHAAGQRRQSVEAANKAEADPTSKAVTKDGDGDGDDNGSEPAFTLPTVPSQLVDPAPATTNPQQDDFESDISARMASLRGLGSLDALGLPSVPTFRPQDHNPSSSAPVGKNLLRSSKYTDEDQKTWCVVCLEDATIRCVGCDDDVYCARCWKEMHVGPSAGYDERGHRWAKFERTAHP